MAITPGHGRTGEPMTERKPPPTTRPVMWIGPPNSDKVRIGGLMRCCLETLSGLYPNGPDKIATEGQRLRCKYASEMEHGDMVFRAGAWEWGPG